MQRIIPTEYVLTSAAITEMQQCDAEWLRLKDLRDQSGTQHGAEWTAMGNRAAELQAVLLDDVASGCPPAFIVKATDAAEWQALPLPPGYWADVVPATAALVRGAVANPCRTKGPKKPGGATPTMVAGDRSTMTLAPTILAAPPKRWRHNP